MANPLDWAARAILQINGMSPAEITKRARQVKRQQPKKPLPKPNTARNIRPTVKPAVRQTRVNGRLKPGAVARPNQVGQPKPVRQGPRTPNVKQQVELSPRSAQKPDGPIGPNSRYTPRSQQKADSKIPSKNVRRLQQAANTKPKSPAPEPSPKPQLKTNPVTRSGPVKGPVPPKSTSAVRLPNSAAQGRNLPNQAAKNLRANINDVRKPAPKPSAAAPKPSPQPQVKTNPVTRSGPVKGPVPPKSTAAVRLPNSAAQGRNLIREGASNLRNATQGPTLRGAAQAGGRFAGLGRLAGTLSTAAGIASLPITAVQGISDSMRVTKADQDRRNAAIKKAQDERKAREARQARVRAAQSKARVNNGTWNQTPSIVPTKKK